MKKINHIGVAVYSLDDSVEIFKKILNINPSKKETVESEGVETIFFSLGKTKIELISSLSKENAIGKYLSKKSDESNIPCFGVLGSLILAFSKLLNQ